MATVKDFIKALLDYPMDAPVIVEVRNINQDEGISIQNGTTKSCKNGVIIEDNGYPYADGQEVFIVGQIKTEEY